MLQARNPSTCWRFNRSSPVMRGMRFQADGEQQGVERDSFLWSLTDLMTLLLVFFIMLYANAINRPLDVTLQAGEQENHGAAPDDARVIGAFSHADQKMQVPEAEGNVSQVGQPEEEEPQKKVDDRPPTEALPVDERVSRQMLTDLADSFSEDFYVRWKDRQPIIVLGERITFNAGEAILLSDARDALTRVAHLIGRLGDCQVVVTGHTDNRPIHTNTFPSNWELSAARAASVAKALMKNNVSAGQLIIQGRSQFNPLVPNTTEANRRSNRRVEISLISD